MSDATKQADGRLLLVHSDDYSGWVFDASHPTQGRRFLNARQRVLALAPEADGTVIGRLHQPQLPLDPACHDVGVDRHEGVGDHHVDG